MHCLRYSSSGGSGQYEPERGHVWGHSISLKEPLKILIIGRPSYQLLFGDHKHNSSSPSLFPSWAADTDLIS